ncbi:MAG: diguanylate cyclase, partial [Cyanobacteria bacterium J06649_11]
MVEVVFQIDSENKFTFLNQAWNDMLGFEIDDSIGKSILSFVDDPSIQYVESIIDSVAKSRGSIRQEIQLVCMDGNSIWVDFSARPDSQGGITGTLTNITQKKQAIQRLSYHVKHDQLTGLLNISAFRTCLDQEIRHHKDDPDYKYSLLFLDLDGFKKINDTMGHLSGDQLIVSVAKRLVSCVRDSDIVARFGGDEFTILLTDITSEKQVISVAQKILDEFKSCFLINNREIFSGVSIGIMLDIHNIFDPHTLLQAADLALYESKANGKSCYSIFDHSMFDQAAKKFRLENEVRFALKEDLVRVHYQPIISIRRQEIIGIEALARIKHPIQGYLSPQDFIPIAEENNQIIELGNIVIQKALAQTQKWISNYGLKESFFVAVNISGKQLASPDFISFLQQTIDEVGIDPSHIHLELTESMLMSNDILVERKLQELRSIGFQIALDDFGTGYS